MSEGVLTILKFCLLVLLYLFVARVVWVVAAEMRTEPAAASGSAPARPAARERRGERPARPAKGWRLDVVEPAAARGSAFEIAGEVTIGRAGGCGIALPDDTFVSHLHARVYERDGEVWVEDLGSTNGTFVNGRRLTKAVRIHKGDRVQAGSTVLEARR